MLVAPFGCEDKIQTQNHGLKHSFNLSCYFPSLCIPSHTVDHQGFPIANVVIISRPEYRLALSPAYLVLGLHLEVTS